MIKAVISKIHNETPKIRSFVLKPVGDAVLPTYSAGSHIKVIVPSKDDTSIKRSYSLFNSSVENQDYRIAVLKEEDGRGGSLFMHEGLAEGDEISFLGPDNDFPLIEGADEYVLIAGGIGITPILSMAQNLKAVGKKFHLHFIARDYENMPLIKEVIEAADGNITIYLDGGDIHKSIPLASVLSSPATGKHLYVCGPAGLIDATEKEAININWKSNQIHFERFSTPLAQEGDEAFTIKLASSNQIIEVSAEETILSALIAAGEDPLSDCEVGNCGICCTEVVDHEGEIQHRDNFLSEAQKTTNTQMCICVSRVKGGQITLDI